MNCPSGRRVSWSWVRAIILRDSVDEVTVRRPGDATCCPGRAASQRGTQSVRTRRWRGGGETGGTEGGGGPCRIARTSCRGRPRSTTTGAGRQQSCTGGGKHRRGLLAHVRFCGMDGPFARRNTVTDVRSCSAAIHTAIGRSGWVLIADAGAARNSSRSAVRGCADALCRSGRCTRRRVQCASVAGQGEGHRRCAPLSGGFSRPAFRPTGRLPPGPVH